MSKGKFIRTQEYRDKMSNILKEKYKNIEFKERRIKECANFYLKRKSFQKGHQINKGIKRTPEQIERIRQMNLGNKYCLGRKATDEARRNMSLAHLEKGVGRKLSEETKRKISNSNKGKIISKEMREKISNTLKKNPIRYWLGKKRSPETIEKLRLSHLGKPAWNKGLKLSDEQKTKMYKYRKGHKQSEETKKKISFAFKNEKHPNWKGGLSKITSLIRRSMKYKEWIQKVFIRDDFICQKCGERGGKLVAHHKKLFCKLIQEVKTNLPLLPLYDAAMIYTPLWDINNGITLCEKCHKSIGHTWNY